MKPRPYWLLFAALGLALCLAVPSPQLVIANDTKADSPDAANDDNDSDDPALDDGKGLLPKAKLSFEDAKVAAKKASPGEVEEIDLEYVGEQLVFDVDMGAKTVRIDALTGALVAVLDNNPTLDND